MSAVVFVPRLTRADEADIVSLPMSYLYSDDIGSDTNSAVVSQLLSYLYSDASGSDANASVVSRSWSYLYSDVPGSDANSAVLSRAVSFLYYDWPGDSAFNLQQTPTVSYFYQFPDAPVLTIIQTNRTPKASEITPKFIPPPPSSTQLEVFTDGAFTNNVALNPNIMTIVLTHGWIATNNGYCSVSKCRRR